MFAVAVNVSPRLELGLGLRIALVGTRATGARAFLGRSGFGVLDSASRIDAAGEGVGAGGEDSPVIVGGRVNCARDGREECVRRVAVPAGGFAHCRRMYSPWTNGIDARVSVLVFAIGAGYFPEVRAVADEGASDGVKAGERVGNPEDIADVVTGPSADGVRFEDCSAVFDGVGLLSNANLTDILPYLHATFGRAIAAGHDVAKAIGFVVRYFSALPEDDSIGGRS